MHDLQFADALRPQRFTVLGLKLLDYTLGHEILLQKERNALVCGGFEDLSWECQVVTLRNAVLHCCARKPLFFKKWETMCGHYTLGGEVKKFREYRASGSLDLPTKDMPRDPKTPYRYFGGPAMARLINYVSENHALMIETHFGNSPLNFPFGLAKMLYLVDAECEGAIWIKNEQDADLAARAKAFEGSKLDRFATGHEAVQKLMEDWNAANPGAQVPLLDKSKAQSPKSKVARN